MLRAINLLTLSLLLASHALAAQQTADDTDEDVDVQIEDLFADFDDFDDGFDDEAHAMEFGGFIEGAYGRRLDADSGFFPSQSLGEVRGRLETEWSNDALLFVFKGDALYDDYLSDWETDARELSLRFSPTDAVDLKIGRQVLTWGTGDLLFLNDLFPKSWVSFFSGRDDEYLKAASNSVRATWYSDAVNLDVVWTPRFEPDDYLTGQRFSFFSPLAADVVAPRPPLAGVEPNGEVENGELALRIFKTAGSTEYAGYLYRGFFKRPLGLNTDLEPFFPRLNVFGGSVRRPIGAGLFNAEFAIHDSRFDSNGADPAIPNDEVRLLVGYEFEARPRFNVAFQYYVERKLDHDALIVNSPTPAFEPDRTRFLITNRLTYRDDRERLTLSLFTFYSPSDSDYYVRPVVTYRKSDQWTISGGANLFGGDLRHTFFGQLEDNSNAYIRARFNY